MDKKPVKTFSDRFYYWLAFRIAGDFGATIAVPAVVATFLGKYLDKKWGSSPWMMVILIAIAFTLTAIIIVRKAKYYGKLFEKGPKQDIVC